MTNDIIATLAKVFDLFVIAGESTLPYKGKPVQVVAEELGVRYVLKGSVQQLDDRLRVTAQLVDAETGKHKWAEQYDRDAEDIFAVRDAITLSIVTALQIDLDDG